MLDRQRVGVSDNRLRGRMHGCQYRTAASVRATAAGPFRIIAGQQDLHWLISLLHMHDSEAKPMPHRSTAISAR